MEKLAGNIKVRSIIEALNLRIRRTDEFKPCRRPYPLLVREVGKEGSPEFVYDVIEHLSHVDSRVEFRLHSRERISNLCKVPSRFVLADDISVARPCTISQ